MISELQISNYKSLQNLTLNVGRFNVFIGENGSGKSNLLEAIAFVAAAAADKLDNEFLVSRGIRVTDSKLMRSAFNDEKLQEPIKISVGFKSLDEVDQYTLTNDNKPYTKWTRQETIDALQIQIIEESINFIQDIISSSNVKSISLLHVEFLPLSRERVLAVFVTNQKEVHNRIIQLSRSFAVSELQKASNYLNSLIVNKKLNSLYSYLVQELKAANEDVVKKYSTLSTNEEISKKYLSFYESKNNLKEYIIFSPENSALRNFYKEGQIEPLGVNGEGLFKLLKVIQDKSPEQLQEIHSCLQLFDWYLNIEIPKDLSPSEDKVSISDRYLTLAFDQRSANEGFLFVLFYITLMVSEDTPKIFAIDNVDVALNPKLCTYLVKELNRLAKKYNKQVFVTTHNPAILDGIDLGDEEQRLFVVSRNKLGHTRLKHISLKNKPRSSTNEELKLSEAFLRGYLGGLPKGF